MKGWERGVRDGLLRHEGEGWVRGGEGTSRTCGARDVVVLWAGDRGGSIICGVHVMSLKAEAEAENSRVCWEYMMDCRLEEGAGVRKCGRGMMGCVSWCLAVGQA